MDTKEEKKMLFNYKSKYNESYKEGSPHKVRKLKTLGFINGEPL